MQTDYRVSIADSWQGRVRDMRGLLELANADTADDLTDDAWAVLAADGYEIDGDNLVGGDQCGDDFRTAADEITASYALSVETYYKRGDVHPDGSDNFEPARIEMALTLGGPTVIVTYDVRGSGWSSYSHSWGMLDGADRHEWDMTSDEHETVATFLATFYVPELDY